MKPSLTILFLFAFLFGLVSQARAAGELSVTFPSAPFFNESNFAPGDEVTKTVTISNPGSVTHLVAIRAFDIEHIPAGLPHLDSVLTIKIQDGASVLYGPVPLQDFFAADSLVLNTINPGQTKNYDVTVVFPGSAGNEHQGKTVIFDLSVGTEAADHLVINEIYFAVDSNHGKDCDNQSSAGGGTNNGSIINNINIDANTGNNNSNGNIGNSNIQTGNINIFIRIVNQIFNSGKQCDEWVELYNPTGEDISLKNWRLVDATGESRKIAANKKIKSGKFALIAKSARTFSRFWSVPSGTQLIELGAPIGNGLGNAGDRIRLLRSNGSEVDAISWGTDSFLPHYAGPLAVGHSLTRLLPGFDTDNGTDWLKATLPSPGS